MEKQFVIYQKELDAETKKIVEELVKQFAFIPTEGFGGDGLCLEYIEPEKAETHPDPFIQQWKDSMDLYNVFGENGTTKLGYCKWKRITRIAVDREAVNEMRPKYDCPYYCN